MIKGSSMGQAIEGFIAQQVRESPFNRLTLLDGSPIFEAPLVGFAQGDDPLFQEFKRVVGPFHWTPREALALDGGPVPETVSVISWILPISQATRESNRLQKLAPSKRWIHTRHHGETFNDVLRDAVVAWLRDQGARAVAPVRTPQFRIYDGEPAFRPPASNWSERHIAYAAGLGTFSLTDGLITPVGIAIRCGSVVTDLPLEPTPRPYAGPYDYCLYLAKGTCGVCMTRCPAGAITPEGHDKAKCAAYIHEELNYLHHAFPGYVTGCGLCQTNVPCERGIPS